MFQMKPKSMEEFAEDVQIMVKNVMRAEGQDESKSTSWEGNDCRGFESVFDSVKAGIPITSGVIANILISRDGGFEVVLSTYNIKDNLRCAVDTTAIPYSMSLFKEIENALSGLLAVLASTISLSHVLMLGITRDRILSRLNTKSTVYLAATSRSIRAALTSPEMDNTYWKKKLEKDFGANEVKEAQSVDKLYWKFYSESKRKSRRHVALMNALRKRHNQDDLRVAPSPRPPIDWNSTAAYLDRQRVLLKMRLRRRNRLGENFIEPRNNPRRNN